MLRGRALPRGGSVPQICKRRRDYEKNPTSIHANAMLQFPATRLPTLRSVTLYVQGLLCTHLAAIIRHRDTHEGFMEALIQATERQLLPLLEPINHTQAKRVIRATLESVTKEQRQRREGKKPLAYTLEWLTQHLDGRDSEWCLA